LWWGKGVVVPDLAPDGRLAAENAALRAENAGLRTENSALRVGHDELERMLAALMERVAQLERQLASERPCPP
jgi:phage shock protein A